MTFNILPKIGDYAVSKTESGKISYFLIVYANSKMGTYKGYNFEYNKIFDVCPYYKDFKKKNLFERCQVTEIFEY